MPDSIINTNTPRKIPFIFLGCVVAVVYWVVDALIDTPLMPDGTLGARLFPSHRQELWMRTVTATVIIAFAIYARSIQGRLRSAENKTAEFVRQLQVALADVLESEAKYRMISDNAHEGICFEDADGKITYLNRRMAEMVGYTVPELQGGSTAAFMDEDTLKEVETRMSQRHAGIGEEYDITLRHRDGFEVAASVAAVPITDDGEFIGSLAMVWDITDRRRLEAQLRQSQKMEAVGQLTGGIAHDFNNLLTVVIGNLQLITDNVDADAALSERIEDALDAGLRGADLTRRLLAFSRQQLLSPKLIAVDKLVAGIEPLLRRTLSEKIRLKIVASGDLWLVEVDPSQLENALINLCINARDAMPNGGRLVIESSNKRVHKNDIANDTEFIAGEYVQLLVRDSGIGMSEAVLQRVFEPFFTTKGIGKGSGLGLSMVYGFVKQSKGYVDIDSTEGEGTSIRIYLPRSRSTAKDTSATGMHNSGFSGRHETILLVEDNDAVRKTLLTLLVHLGYRVVEAVTGAEALSVLNDDEDIDLLFSDIVMPGGMTGIELADHVHQRYPNLKVLLTSGTVDADVHGSDYLQRGNEVLEKPYQKKRLEQALRDVLDRD